MSAPPDQRDEGPAQRDQGGNADNMWTYDHQSATFTRDWACSYCSMHFDKEQKRWRPVRWILAAIKRVDDDGNTKFGGFHMTDRIVEEWRWTYLD